MSATTYRSSLRSCTELFEDGPDDISDSSKQQHQMHPSTSGGLYGIRGKQGSPQKGKDDFLLIGRRDQSIPIVIAMNLSSA